MSKKRKKPKIILRLSTIAIIWKVILLKIAFSKKISNSFDNFCIDKCYIKGSKIYTLYSILNLILGKLNQGFNLL